jgi:hypothetical protein
MVKMTIQNTNTNKSELEHNNRQNSKIMLIKTELIQELMKEENILKVDAYIGTFTRGDFRYLVSLATEDATLILSLTRINDNK